MSKAIFNGTLIISAIFIILISLFTNIIIGVSLLLIIIALLSLLKNANKSVDGIILVAVFLTPCSNIFVYKTGYIDLRILQFIWLALFMFIAIQKAVTKDNSFYKRTNINDSVIFTIYLIGLIFSCLFSINMAISLKELFQYVYLFFIMYVLFTKAKNEAFFNKIINVLIISNIILVCACLISYFTGKLLIPSFYMYSNGTIEVLDTVYVTQELLESSNVISRISGVMGLDTIAIANCILIHSLIINYKIRQASGKIKFLFMILFIANAATIVITYSRAALIIFFVINYITLMGKEHKKNFMLIILAVCSVPFILSMFPTIYERVLEAFNLKEGSTKYHFVYWIVALREGYDNILTGIGLGNGAYVQDMYVSLFSSLFSYFNLYKADAANIHNFILQIWAEQGLIGLFSSMIFIFYPIIHYIRIKFVQRIINGKTIFDFIILAYISTLLFNLTNNNFYIETFWVMAALVYACKFKYAAKPIKLPIGYLAISAPKEAK